MRHLLRRLDHRHRQRRRRDDLPEAREGGVPIREERRALGQAGQGDVGLRRREDVVHVVVRHTERFRAPLAIVADQRPGARETRRRDHGRIW